MDLKLKPGVETMPSTMRLGPRRQCPEHQREIDTQIKELLDLGIIERVNADANTISKEV